MPTTTFHHRLALIVAAGLLVDGVDVYLTAGVSGALLREGFVSLFEVAYLAMATTAGLTAGGLLAGLFADRFGRLALMRVTMALVVIGAIGAALSPSFTHLLSWRLLAALGLGGETVLAYGVLAEFMPPGARGRWMAWVALLGSFGLPLTLGVGYFILPHPEGWRWMLAIPGAAGLGVFILRFALPESPRWLEARGRRGEAEAIVARVEATASRSAPRERPAAASASAQERSSSSRLWSRLVAAAAINVAAMSAVYGFVSWLPTFFVASGQSVASSTLFSGVMAFGAPIGTLAAMLITDRIERKHGVVASALLIVLFGAAYARASDPAAIMGLGFLVVVMIYVFGTLGLVSYVPELFPTRVRLRAIGLVSAIGRGAAFALPVLVAAVFSARGQAGVIAVLGAVLVAHALAVALLGPRTRGRSLEDV